MYGALTSTPNLSQKELDAKPFENTKMTLKEERIYVLSDQPGQQCGMPTS